MEVWADGLRKRLGDGGQRLHHLLARLARNLLFGRSEREGVRDERAGWERAARRGEGAANAPAGGASHEDAHLADDTVVGEGVGEVGVGMVEHEAPAEAGGEKAAAVTDKVEDGGDIFRFEARGDEKVSLAEFGRRVDPPGVRDAEVAQELERRLAAAQGGCGDGTVRLWREPADRVLEKPRRVRELLACVEVGGVAEIDRAALAIKGRRRGEGACAVKFAVGKREGVVGENDERTWQRSAADIDGVHAVEQGGGGLALRLRRRGEKRGAEGKEKQR